MTDHLACILIIEPQLDHLRWLSEILTPKYHVVDVSEARLALDLLRRTPVDLAVLPVTMPDTDGYSLCRALRSLPATEALPVIFTHDGNELDIGIHYFALDNMDVIAKPAHEHLLHNRVQAQLARAKQRGRTLVPINYRIAARALRERETQLKRKDQLEQEMAGRASAEAALRESQARFLRLTRELKDNLFFFATTTSGQMLYLSDGALGLGATQSAQRLGQHWRDLAAWTPESISKLLDVFTRFVTGEQVRADFELSYQGSQDSRHYLAVHAYLVHEQGQSFIEGVAFNISERKAHEVRLRTLQRVIEQAPVSILITDAQANIVYVNPFFCQISGYEAAEVIGQNPRVFKSGEQADSTYNDLWQTLSRGETWRGELVNKRHDGSLYWESATISPIRDEHGRTSNYLAVKEDIGDRKELERIKSDVERIMHHDLKNPLNAILALPELLLLDDNLTAEQRDSLVMLLDAGRQMRDMIDLSLDLFKMETGQFNYVAKTLNLVPILHQVAQLAESRGCARGLELHFRLDGIEIQNRLGVDLNLPVLGDSRLLFSMLSNLTSNAIDASPDGERVFFELWRDNPIRLAIVNRGVVPLAIREYFFEKYRTHGKEGGTGLGTYSAKLMADTMKMDLRMETSDECNTTWIYLHMPVPD